MANDEQLDEIEVLRSIYSPEDLEIHGSIITYNFSKQTSIDFRLGQTIHYPSSERPVYVLLAPYHTDHEKTALSDLIEQTIDENSGGPCISQI